MLSGFVDESKSNVYVLSLVVVGQEQLPSARRMLRELVLPGQRSLHFSKESMVRRGEILDRILSAKFEMFILNTGLKSHREGRSAGLISLGKLTKELKMSTLFIERDDSTFTSDHQILRDKLRRGELGILERFDFPYRHEEPMLWAADALAWSYQKGGSFRRKLRDGGVEVIIG